MSGRVMIVDGVAAAGPAVPAALRRQGFLVSTCGETRELPRLLGEIEPQVVIVEGGARPRGGSASASFGTTAARQFCWCWPRG